MTTNEQILEAVERLKPLLEYLKDGDSRQPFIDLHTVMDAAQECIALRAALDECRGRVKELEKDEAQIIKERDMMEDTVGEMYLALFNKWPEWTSSFGHREIVEEVKDLAWEKGLNANMSEKMQEEMPKEIWAKEENTYDRNWYPFRPREETTKFIRADLHEAELARLKEVAGMMAGALYDAMDLCNTNFEIGELGLILSGALQKYREIVGEK